MDVNGCKNFSNIIPLTGQPSILAYPNPTSTIFNLKFEDETTGRAIISVFNSKGYKVMEFQTEKQSNELMLKDIPVNNLTSGVYIIQIMMNQTDFFTTRLVVLKN
jgi:hypothetical protein